MRGRKAADVIKRVTVLRRRDDIGQGEAMAHWTAAHVELVEQVAGVARYVQRPCTESIDSASDPTLLGIGEVWFETRSDAVAATGTPEWAAVIDHARTFVTLPPVAVCWVQD
jgi:uncharacterized protein (TIGR02118 family)